MKPNTEPLTLLSPYNGQPCVKLINSLMPQILITWKAYRATLHFLEHSRRIGTEFSWVGKVIPLSENNPGQYLIAEVKALAHNSTTVSTTLDALAIAKLAQQWIKASKEGYNPLKFWGHTHMGSSVEPSVVDNNQMSSLIRGELTPKFFIRGIFGLRGKAENTSYGCPVEFTLFDYTKGIQIRNVPWRVIDRSYKEEKVLEKLQTTKVSSLRTSSLTRQRRTKGKIGKSE